MSENIKEAHEAHENEEFSSDSGSEPSKRIVVIPGEVIAEGEDYLPGEGTRRDGANVVATKFGLAEISGRVIKLIPIFGAFVPRRGNVVVGRVTNIMHSGWTVDIDSASDAFVPIEESPRFINRNEMDQYLAIGDVLAAKIWSVKGRGIDLTLKGKGLGKLEDGFIFRIIPSRVPRVIGREGSMVNLIKEKTGCNITIGQNGWIWISGPSTDAEIRARKAVELIADKVHLGGLTEMMESWFEENK